LSVSWLSIRIFACAILAACSLATAESDTATGKRTEVFGSAALEVGQIVKGHYRNISGGDIGHIWMGDVIADLSAQRQVNQYLSVLVSLEGRMWYNSTPLYMQIDWTTFGAPTQNFSLSIPNAVGKLHFGDKEANAFNLNFGRWEYKYNPQAQDLGEYLFRTGCYPTYIETNFDLPLARINGVSISHSYSDFFRQDLMLTTLSEVRPFFDFTLTYVADLALGKVLDLGAGVQFDRFLSVDPSHETDPKTYPVTGYLNAPGDTGYYTFSGTKLMGRFSFDPKNFFDAPFFGKNDGILYAEAAILGVKNYPASNSVIVDSLNPNTYNIFGYDKLLEKMPIMFGCNIPAFKLLDNLSLEFEWFGSKYPNSLGPYYSRVPTPANPNDGIVPDDYLHDDWKWDISARKTIFGGISFIGLIGRDHLRTVTQIARDMDYEDALIKPDNWYWMFKIKSNF
jgi:hypothetical protein